MSLLKSAVRSLLYKAGHDIVPRHNRSSIILLDALEKLLPRIETVVDVGANRGQFGAYLRDRLKFRGRIVSFEPNPADFLILSERAATDDLWDAYPCALGSENTELTLQVMESTDLSSFRSMAHNGETAFSSCPVAAKVRVPVRRLDDVVAELDLKPSTMLVKADTQGFDLEVFRGGAKTISAAVAILSEVSQIPIYESALPLVETLGELTGYGYRIAAMAPVSFHEGAVLEFDCLLLNQHTAR